jgi:hypothetical protein
MKVIYRVFLLSILVYLTQNTVVLAQTVSVSPESSAPHATVSASLSSATSTMPWMPEYFPAQIPRFGPIPKPGMQPLSSDLMLTNFDATAPVHDWHFYFQAGNLLVYAPAERFTLPTDSGFVDSVKIVFDAISGDSITVLLDPDTLYTTSAGEFHFVNIFSTTAQRFAGVTFPVPAASGAFTLNLVFPHVPVTKNFHVVVLPRYTVNGTQINFTSQFSLRADSEATRTPTADNAFSTFLGINLQTSQSTTGIMDGYFVPAGDAGPLYTNFDIQAFVSTPTSTLTLSSTSHDFGNVLIGSSPSFGFKLSNNSANPVTITDISLSPAGTDFTAPTPIPPFPLKAGGSTFVTADFSPTSEGPQSATMTLTMDDGSTLQIALSGTGVASGVSPITPLDQSLSVFPNPASSSLQIQSGEPVTRVEVLDLLGRTVLSQELSGNRTLDVSRLEPGRYEAVVHSASGVVTAPVIIQR